MHNFFKNIKNINRSFLISDQCIVQLSDNNKLKFFRVTFFGEYYEVNVYGNPVSPKGTVLKNVKALELDLFSPPLTFHKHIPAGRLFNEKKSSIINNLNNVLTNIGNKKKREVKSLNIINFHLFLKTLIGDIPPVSVLNTPTNTSPNILKTNYFEINFRISCVSRHEYDFYYDKDSDTSWNVKNNEYTQISKNYFLSFLDIQYILEELYPSADLNQILTMRTRIISGLKNLGFPEGSCRTPTVLLPNKFYNRLLSTSLYKIEHKSIKTRCLFGIRLIHKLF